MAAERRPPAPKYVPKQYVQNPGDFGRATPGLRWRLSPGGLTDATLSFQRRGAQDPVADAKRLMSKYMLGAAVQHAYALAMRDIVDRLHVFDSYSFMWRVANLDELRMTKIMNGHVPLPLDDLGIVIDRLQSAANVTGWLPDPDAISRSVALARRHEEERRSKGRGPTAGLMDPKNMPRTRASASNIDLDATDSAIVTDYLYEHARSALIALHHEVFPDRPEPAFDIDVDIRDYSPPGTVTGFPSEDEITIGLYLHPEWVSAMRLWGAVHDAKLIVHFDKPVGAERPTGGLAARVLPESISVNGDRMGDWRIVDSPVKIKWKGDTAEVKFTIEGTVKAAEEQARRTGSTLNRY